MRRRVKLNNGEESEDRSGNDKDSGNEARIKKKAAKKRAAPGGFGFGFGGRRRGFQAMGWF